MQEPTDTSRSLRIAYVIPGTDVSGGIAVVCQHANRLRARGHEVLLASETPGRTMDWFPRQSVPIVGVDELPSDLDAIVATGWQTSFRVAAMPARHRFYFVQSDETRFHPAGSPWRHLTRLSYGLDVDFLTEARWIQRWLRETFGKDSELVPNGLDETIFYPAKPLVPKGRKPRVLIEGALALPYKGMAEAYAAIAEEDVEIWCVSSLGRPPGHWRCGRFFEKVPMSQMRHIYSSCDILLKLSRVEGFFGPPMEMMACGGAVVVGRVTGYDEYIRDGVNALVVDVDRPEEATAAVRRLIHDPELRASLVQAGLETARAWRWEPSIDLLERLFLDVAEGRRGIVVSPPSEHRSFSLAYLYRLLRGEILEEPPHLMGEGTQPGLAPDWEAARIARLLSPAVATDPTEKLIDRLRQRAWFRSLARGVYRAHRSRVVLPAKLRSLADDGSLETLTYPGIRQVIGSPWALPSVLRAQAQLRRDRRLVASSPLFDPAWYLVHHPGVAKSGVEPVRHYLTQGAAEGADPSRDFSTSAYVAGNPDVARSGMNPLVHYLRHGAKEGRALDQDDVA